MGGSAGKIGNINSIFSLERASPLKKLCNDFVWDGNIFSVTINIIANRKLTPEETIQIVEYLQIYTPASVYGKGNFFHIFWDPSQSYPTLASNLANHIVSQISSDLTKFLQKKLIFEDYVMLEIDLYEGSTYEEHAALNLN